MNGSTAKRLRKTTAIAFAADPTLRKVGFKRVYRNVKKRWNRLSVVAKAKLRGTRVDLELRKVAEYVR
jgi:hypothetical protein